MTITWPYAHLLINHFPVVLSFVALAVAILALVLGRRGLWLTAMAALTLAGLFVYPVFFTGNQADHALDDPWYIKHGTIEAHDAAASWTLWVILLVRSIRRLLVVEISEEAGRGDSRLDAGGRCDRIHPRRQHRGAHFIPRRTDHPRITGTSAQGCSGRTSARCRHGAAW